MSTPEAARRDTIGPVLGRTPSGLFILTACGPDGAETGMLASWVQQASFEPPTMTVAVNRKRYINDWMPPGASVALNLLGETQKSLLGHFARGFDPGAPAFTGIDVVRTPLGCPALTAALGWLEGRITGRLDAGDHFVHTVELTAAGSNSALETEKPWVHLRKNGFNY
jgi:flavin reductase (DIM6/NTAB) family NADH-FMN oxidoreductase RutF